MAKKQYTVKSLYLYEGNKMYRSGDIVTADNFPSSNFESLIERGFITDGSADGEQDEEEVDERPVLFSVDREGQTFDVRSIEDINKSEIIDILKAKSIEHKEADKKSILWDLLNADGSADGEQE